MEILSTQREMIRQLCLECLDLNDTGVDIDNLAGIARENLVIYISQIQPNNELLIRFIQNLTKFEALEQIQIVKQICESEDS